MKRFLWLSCLCFICPLAAIGCGDDDTASNNSEDGGMVDVNDIHDQVEGINANVNDISGHVDQLGTSVDGLNKDVDDLNSRAKKLEDGLSDLQKGNDTNCSETESCIPDGVDVVQSALKDIVKQVCAQEINCCTSDELVYKFGPAIQSVDDCVSTFTDLVNSGFSPSFLSGSGYLVHYVIQMAQALNDPSIKIEIDAKGAKDCLALISKQECPKYVAPEDITRCVPYEPSTDDEEDICSPAVLVTGLQKKGELCGIQNLPGIPTCEKKLVCRSTGGEHGICADPTQEGDTCTNDSECDSADDLFCNASTGKCQVRSGVGEPCAYTDPSFEQNEYNPMNNSGGLAIECQTGLSCNPKSKKCVASCDEGALCYYGVESEDPNQNCPEGLICNITETANLYQGTHSNWYEGVCRKPTAKNKACTQGSECDSGVCEINDDGDSVCQTAQSAEGASCDTKNQPDETCKSGYCNDKGKCAATCVLDESDAWTGCPKNYYCDHQQAPAYGDEDGTHYLCMPTIANGDTCLGTYEDAHTDTGCKSGYCNGSLVCADKLVDDDPTTCTRSAECADDQYCDKTLATPICTALLAEGATCPPGDADGACGAPNTCIQNSVGAYQCHALAGDGDDCGSILGINCASPLTCDTTDNKCYANTARGTGAHCTSDLQCDSGWCSELSSLTPTCAKPIADGKACDSEDQSKNRCGENSYCKFPDDDTKGKCTKRSTAGQECSPRFGGLDCLKNQFNDIPNAAGNCTEVHDLWLCDSTAVPSEKLFCDGP